MSAFEIEFECENCGNEWTDEFNEGELVKQNITSTERGMSIYTSSKFGRQEYQDNVKCPVCETYQKVQSVNRSPIADK